MDTITTIVVYLGFSFVFGVAVLLFLQKRSMRHRASYPEHWDCFKKALASDITTDIANFGSLVVWNENLEQEHKKIVYREIENRKDRPELQQLWKDVHYKTHGAEPV